MIARGHSESINLHPGWANSLATILTHEMECSVNSEKQWWKAHFATKTWEKIHEFRTSTTAKSNYLLFFSNMVALDCTNWMTVCPHWLHWLCILQTYCMHFPFPNTFLTETDKKISKKHWRFNSTFQPTDNTHKHWNEEVHARLYPSISRQHRSKNGRPSSPKRTASTNADATMTNNRRWRDQNNDVWSPVCRNQLTTNRCGDRGQENKSDVARLHNELLSSSAKYTAWHGIYEHPIPSELGKV